MVDLKQEVENLGAFFEQRNMTPMESRVFALLLLAEPHYQNFYAIQEFLGASKSAISNAINRLLDSKQVDYLTLPGDRKRYFKVNPDRWLEQMKMEIAFVVPMLDKVNGIINRRSTMDTPEFNKDLERVRDFYAFMAEEFPKLIDKWNQQDTRA